MFVLVEENAGTSRLRYLRLQRRYVRWVHDGEERLRKHKGRREELASCQAGVSGNPKRYGLANVCPVNRPKGLLLEQRINELFRVERKEVPCLLADSDEAHRQAELSRNRHHHAALRSAVEFSEDDAGHARGLGE